MKHNNVIVVWVAAVGVVYSGAKHETEQCNC